MLHGLKVLQTELPKTMAKSSINVTLTDDALAHFRDCLSVRFPATTTTYNEVIHG
jgi:hypothetical protein